MGVSLILMCLARSAYLVRGRGRGRGRGRARVPRGDS